MIQGLSGNIVMWGIIIIIALVIFAYIMHWFYYRTRKGYAFVRTGLGGEKVIINSGAFVIPIIHEITAVNLNVVRIPVALTKEQSLITKDHARIDIQAEMFVKVQQEKAAVSRAAASLGNKTTDIDDLTVLLVGKFMSAMRSVAASKTLDEMHQQREQYIKDVSDSVAKILTVSGLELETFAILELDQTDLSHFTATNRFDAEGLTLLVKTIESERESRNDIEKSSMIAIRKRNLEAEKETLLLDKASEEAKISKTRAISELQAEQQNAIKQHRIAKETEAEKIRIQSELITKTEEIAADESVEQARVTSKIAVLKKQKEQAQAIIDHEKAQIGVVQAQQEVKTKQKSLEAECEILVDKMLAEKSAEIAQIMAKAEKISGETAAQVLKITNEANNILSDDARQGQLRSNLIEKLVDIVRESARPLENIEGIKILHISGMDGGGNKQLSPTDEVIQSALRYRAQAPLIDEMMKELGIENSGVAKMGDIFRPARDMKALAKEAAAEEKNKEIVQDTSSEQLDTQTGTPLKNKGKENG